MAIRYAVNCRYNLFVFMFAYIPYHKLLLLMLIFLSVSCSKTIEKGNQYGLPLSPEYYQPEEYYCESAPLAPVVDGVLSSEEWDDFSWSSPFVSSVNEESVVDMFSTLFKVLYHNDTLYFAARLNENHIWAVHDDCISSRQEDNFLEIFIDSDSDEFDFLCIKVNAFGSVCGEYRTIESKEPLQYFSLKDTLIRCGVYVNGTLNDPGDEDEYWTVELAIPINLSIGENKVLNPAAIWKFNILRTRWQYVIVSGYYKQILDADTGEKYLGDQWIWSPIGSNSIHHPELWGECNFLALYPHKQQSVNPLHIRQIKWELRNVFYAQHLHFKKHGRYAHKLAGLKDVGFDLSALHFKPKVHVRRQHFNVIIEDKYSGKRWVINQVGQVSKADLN
jgi:hypothetical protein